MPRISELNVNGKSVRVDADGERTLLSVLRDDLELTGCKYGCGEGQCGACTVLLDGVPTRSCRTNVGDVESGNVVTVESLERNGRLHPVQEAFLAADAMQCGFCTCGLIMAGVALLQKSPDPTDEEIVRALHGHICRCGVYQRIVAAIKAAAKAMREGRA
jgi:aerobic-type carbon monoxide dehydrogenase small subunit (CoxS/CutS family)